MGQTSVKNYSCVNGDVRVSWSYRASITDVRMGFCDLVVTSEDWGTISRAETLVRNYGDVREFL